MPARVKRWAWFFVGGCVNTAFTFGIYRILITKIGYQVAYLIVCVIGIVFSYFFNSLLVFKVPVSWRGLFNYPLVYVIQYTISAVALEILVVFLGLSKDLAPLLILPVVAPIIYILSKKMITFTGALQNDKK